MMNQQYEFVLSSRGTILDYIKTISQADFTAENSTFGRGSIRNLLVHICDTYASWIGERSLRKKIIYKGFDEYSTLPECLAYFHDVDGYVEEFVNTFKDNPHTELEIIRNGEIIALNPLKLFTHVITHEFHHQGQIMSLSRHLGYTPVDADIIR